MKATTVIARATLLILPTLAGASCSGEREPSTERGLSAAPDSVALATFDRCIICHGETGEGLPAVYPPFVNSAILTGPPEIPIRIISGGLEGPITIDGTLYDGTMPQWGDGPPMTAAQLASLLTYLRTSFGNQASPVTEAQVARVLEADTVRARPWTATELGIR